MAERQKTPFICSLQSLEIQLNDDIRRHLSDQYGKRRGGSQQEGEAKEDDHLELILSAMKLPPAFTTCRVNLIRATRKEVFDELQSQLSTNPQLKVVEDTGFPDVINIVPASRHLSIDSGIGVETIKDAVFDKTSLSSSTGPDGNTEDDEKDATTLSKEISKKSLFSGWPSRREQGWSMSHRCIICDRFCGEAVLRGSDIFVMGVMAADANIREGETVAVYADIPRKTNSNSKGCAGGDKLPRGLKLEHYQGKCVYLGMGTTECSRSEIFKNTRGVAITMSLDAKDRVGPPLPPLYGVLPDKMMLQNLPSVLVGHALNPQPNDVILDMCSAPGGKTSHLSSLVRNDAVIIACDKSKKKVAAAKELFTRMGASCITPLALDATNCCVERQHTEDEGGKDSSKHKAQDVQQVRRYDGLLILPITCYYTGACCSFKMLWLNLQRTKQQIFTNRSIFVFLYNDHHGIFFALDFKRCPGW
jgi:hypothetical protein